MEDEDVQAWLLTPYPSLSDLVPAIVAIHQDGGRRPYDIGKSEPAGLAGDSDLAYGLELCLNGYIVLCPDRFGFESRSLASSSFASTFASFRIQTVDSHLELTEDLYKGAAANRLLFRGWSMLGKEVFELTRAVDVLTESVSGVDPDRIGAIGHSAGGLLVSYLMYLDDRVSVGCASCGSWRFASAFEDDYLRPMQGFGTTLAVPGMASWGDTDDVLAGIAPRPYWEHCGDVGALGETERLIKPAAAKYAELGLSDRFRYLAHDAGHSFPQTFRKNAYSWFAKWLQ